MQEVSAMMEVQRFKGISAKKMNIDVHLLRNNGFDNSSSRYQVPGT